MKAKLHVHKTKFHVHKAQLHVHKIRKYVVTGQGQFMKAKLDELVKSPKTVIPAKAGIHK